ELFLLSRRVAIDGGEAGVETADRQPPIPQQLFSETTGVDAQIRTFDEILRETGVSRDLLRERLPFTVGHPVAFCQTGQVLVPGERARVVHRLPQIALQVGRELLVIPGGRRVGLDVRRVRDVVLRRRRQRLVRQQRRDEGDAVQLDAVADLQLLRQT